MSEQPTPPLQNDPDRAAGSLVPDAVGEFVEDSPGGAFDPRSYRAAPADDADPPQPGAGGPRTSGPGAEADKLR
jgi:hypothetical protein